MDAKEMMTTDSKIKAAYALNLCTVSVSQIVDYNDINVLEQEYEAILNNLNLEHMPHDEALLLILKQLLDTITFFRIQEGDKRIMDLRYREKMKNAIWNAVPNFGLIVAGGNPITIAISLASQVGIGYMNYRKEKANNELDYEEEKWKLQRVAIEQFNGLRRELFDTAWRLADTYGFEDELRLTERQIKHYDSILMDDNALRKYDRLDSIKNNFVAYPPFWYYLGSTANEISRDETLSISEETRQFFRQKAREHFKQFWESNKYPLLREDQLSSSCALEYADILIEDGDDKEQIEELIDKAAKYAGNACDILQLCAIAYLRIDAYEKAIPALRILVNEKYNSSVNAQLLSGIYIREFRAGNNPEIKSQYESLEHRVSNGAYLIPWPTSETIPEKEFYDNQRDMLQRRYKQAINNFRDKYIALFNMIIPIPDDELEHADADYTEASRDKRVSAIEHILASARRESFLSTINDISFGVEYINLLNKMFTSLSSLSVITDADKLIAMTEQHVTDEAKKIESIQGRMREFSFSDSDYEALQEITSEGFLSDVFEETQKQVADSIGRLEDMGQISATASEMVEFCHDEGIALPESREDKMQEVIANSGKQYYLSYKILGEKAEYYSKVMEKKEIMTAIIRKKAEKALNGGINMMMIFPGDAFNEYFSKSSKAVKKYKNEVLAILDDRSFLFDTDLLFTTTGILIVERNTLKEICSYESVAYDSQSGKLTLGSVNYHHANVDSAKMYEALVELKQASSKR